MRLSGLVESSEGALVPVGPIDPDPDVAAVVTTDLLEPGRYLAGRELVLTGLAWWQPGQPTRSRGFVAALRRSNVAALAAGEAALGGVPEDLVEACAEAGLPLLRVPVAYSFAELTERATHLLTTDVGLLAVLARHRALLAEATGLSTVLSLVAAELGVAVWVLTATGRPIAVSTPMTESSARRWARQFLTAQRLPVQVKGVSLVAADPSRSRASGWILALDDDHSGWTAARRSVVDELAGLVALELDRSLRPPDTHVQLAHALAGASAGDVEQALARLGWPAGDPSVVVLAAGDEAATVLTEAMVELPAAFADGLGLVRTDDPASVITRLSATVDLLRPGLGTFHAGVSDAVSGGAGLLGAVAEARAALAVATTSPSVVGPDRLSSHAVLLAAVPVELREAYRRRVLGPLLDHDRAHRTDLVRTLAAYLETSGSWARCAARMHLHVNTVRYRIERIEALTGRDLRRLDDQADLLLALHLP